jgi:hypothetical protein
VTFDLMEFIKLYGHDIAITGLVLIGLLGILIIYLDVKEQNIKKEIQRKYARGEI